MKCRPTSRGRCLTTSRRSFGGSTTSYRRVSLFSRGGASFPQPAMSDEERKIFLAIIPSTFGNWWGDEFLWFMPSLRFEILKTLPATRSGVNYLDVDALREVAKDLVKGKRPGEDYRYDSSPAAPRHRACGQPQQNHR